MPFFSALTCCVMVWVSLYDSLSVEERRLKQIVTIYLATDACAWLMCFCYSFYPRTFVYLNVPCFLSFVLVPILFYRMVCFLTLPGKKEEFSRLHYLVPVLYGIVLLVWSFFVPFEVQLKMVEGQSFVFLEGYEGFSFFFLSKPQMRGIFGIIYFILIVKQLIQYTQKAKGSSSLIRKPLRGTVFLMALSLSLLFTSLLLMFFPRSIPFSQPCIVVAMIITLIQHILLAYYIIRRQYVLYVIPEEVNTKLDSKKGVNDSERRRHHGKITRRKLESYFRNEKPYLRADFKITELVEVFDVNRTTLSSFINRTYGMNFNGYVNKWRLKEFKRLSGLAENKRKSIQSYVTKAGFYDLRQYYRVVKREREKKQRGNDSVP